MVEAQQKKENKPARSKWLMPLVMAALLTVALLLSTFYLELSRIFGGFALYLTLFFFIPLLGFCIYYIWKLIFAFSGGRFRSHLLPAFCSLALVVLYFISYDPLFQYQLEASFNRRLPRLDAAVTALQAQGAQGTVSVEAALAAAKKCIVYPLPSGENAYLFVEVESTDRMEGFIYLPNDFLYDEILINYSDSSFRNLSGHFVFVILYK